MILQALKDDKDRFMKTLSIMMKIEEFDDLITEPDDALKSPKFVMLAYNYAIVHKSLATLEFLIDGFVKNELTIYLAPFSIMILVMSYKSDQAAVEKLDILLNTHAFIKKNDHKVNQITFTSNMKHLENDINENLIDTINLTSNGLTAKPTMHENVEFYLKSILDIQNNSTTGQTLAHESEVNLKKRRTNNPLKFRVRSLQNSLSNVNESILSFKALFNAIRMENNKSTFEIIMEDEIDNFLMVNKAKVYFDEFVNLPSELITSKSVLEVAIALTPLTEDLIIELIVKLFEKYIQEAVEFSSILPMPIFKLSIMYKMPTLLAILLDYEMNNQAADDSEQRSVSKTKVLNSDAAGLLPFKKVIDGFEKTVSSCYAYSIQ